MCMDKCEITVPMHVISEKHEYCNTLRTSWDHSNGTESLQVIGESKASIHCWNSTNLLILGIL